MFGDEVFVEKSFEEMEQDMKDLLAESERLKKEAADIMVKANSLRNESVDLRFQDPERAEGIWQESERLREESNELKRLSVDKNLKASDIKHRLDIHDQIVAVVDHADEIWKGAIRAKRP